MAGGSDLISKYDFVSCGIHNQSQVKGYLLNIRKNCMQKIIVSQLDPLMYPYLTDECKIKNEGKMRDKA